MGKDGKGRERAEDALAAEDRKKDIDDERRRNAESPEGKAENARTKKNRADAKRQMAVESGRVRNVYEDQLNRLMAQAATNGMDPKAADEEIERRLTRELVGTRRRPGVDTDPLHAAAAAHDAVTKQRERFADGIDKAVVDGNTAALLKLGVSLQALQRGVPLVFR